jgi:hypothetical protein
VIVVVVILGLTSGAATNTSATPRTPVPSGFLAQAKSIPLTDMLGASGSVSSLVGGAYDLSSTAAPKLTSGGKPEMLFIGAEYCPNCAAERWAMLLALDQFGTFSNVSQIRSANRDGDIATLSFYQSTYTSPYLDFVPEEIFTNIPAGNTYKPLQKLTTAQSNLWAEVSQLTGQSGESFPFVYLGGRYVLSGAQYQYTVLSGASFAKIASSLGNNNTAIGSTIDASAIALTKYICGMTGQKPAATCAAAAAVAAPISTASSGTSTPATS